MDDSMEPITLEWFRRQYGEVIDFENGSMCWNTRQGDLEFEASFDDGHYYQCVIVPFPGCRTRGDVRELCRLLGVASW